MNSSQDQRESQGIVDALNQIDGISVRSVYDLVNTRRKYPEAIPVLVRFLTTGIQDQRVLEGVVRALSVSEARGKANGALFDLFLSLPIGSSPLKWAIGNALKVIAVPSDYEAIKSVVLDSKHGIARQELVAALGKFKTIDSEVLLVKMLDDEQVAAHALEALIRLKSPAGLDKAQTLLKSTKPAVRKEAEKYIQRSSRRGH